MKMKILLILVAILPVLALIGGCEGGDGTSMTLEEYNRSLRDNDTVIVVKEQTDPTQDFIDHTNDTMDRAERDVHRMDRNQRQIIGTLPKHR